MPYPFKVLASHNGLVTGRDKMSEPLRLWSFQLSTVIVHEGEGQYVVQVPGENGGWSVHYTLESLLRTWTFGAVQP